MTPTDQQTVEKAASALRLVIVAVAFLGAGFGIAGLAG